MAWTQIGIVLSILWAVFIILYARPGFPDLASIQKERIRGFYEKLMERERRINPDFETRYGHVTAAGLADAIIEEEKADQYAASILNKWADELDFSEIEERYNNARQRLPVKRLKYIEAAFLFWAVPVILAYGFGWVIIRSRGVNRFP
jgi:hypothetical protein